MNIVKRSEAEWFLYLRLFLYNALIWLHQNELWIFASKKCFDVLVHLKNMSILCALCGFAVDRCGLISSSPSKLIYLEYKHHKTTHNKTVIHISVDIRYISLLVDNERGWPCTSVRSCFSEISKTFKAMNLHIYIQKACCTLCVFYLGRHPRTCKSNLMCEFTRRIATILSLKTRPFSHV